MKKIMKWLDGYGIKYSSSIEGRNEYITIMLKPDCTWINGFGEPMKYDKKIVVHFSKHFGYSVHEYYGYNLVKTLTTCRKADAVIETLKERFTI